jgi:restriction endonuclease S subunit
LIYLTAGQSFVLGYTNETTGIFKDNLPVIIFDDFTTASKFVDFPFKVKSSAMKILKPRDGVNLKYVYYTMQNIQFNSEIHKRYWISEYSKVRIPLPPLHIQEEIVKEIEGYQKIIDGAKQVVDNYKPTIKIDPSWEMTRIDDVVEFVSGVTLAVKDCENPNGLPLITIADVSEEGYLQLDNIRTVNTTKNVNILHKGDLLFNWRNGSKHLVGKTALFDLDGDYIFASFLLGIRPNQNIVKSKFMWLLLNQYRSEGKYLQFMRQNVNGLFNREELKEVLIPVPSIETQQTVIARIQEEMAIIEQNKRLIKLFEQRIKDKISEVWGE